MIGADIQDPQEVKGQIASIVQTLADSWNSHDMDLYAAQFADDADFVNVLGMHWHGRPEIAARHAEVHRTIFRNSKLRVLDHSVRPLAPDIVLAHITWEMTGHEPPPGILSSKVRQGIITVVFVERDGRWLITAFHNTDIVPMPPPGKP